MTGDFRSYYGKPVLNRPTWKNPDVPAYLFSGGMAGASAVIAELAAATGRPALTRVARLGAAGGAMAGAGLLVHDLGRPARFLNMLRMFKVTSPLSVGSWILAPFSGLTALAAASELSGYAPALGRAAGVGAAALGGPMTTYTAVLISNTAVPAWHEAHRDLPVVFASSAVAAGGALGLVGVGTDENAPAARLAVLGAAAELAASTAMERRLGPLGTRYTTGRAGRWRQAARLLTATGAVGALLGRRRRAVAVASGLAVLAGSLATRFAVFHAGLASAADPADTVVPQRQRLGGREQVEVGS
ncbi:formate-dependent nitrite reductase membrane component NrfD [Pseudonocardia hierapolitana]|uniref:Formate-dependent nitrite reductase membrane component NrfD n=1 Tax=Pseudonocardia hierapolitana TaxID=1128676 RepID=A0A561SH10_9PSEU|nr:NrfD/PsrC family molybdoenzyme membrane anchor subunit [Pseudonocardia hierapolitana]TWF74148.1 formate-dependent nitrite reductase membrane component NrfD [Pseudonocardia hierapolitana]